MDTKAALNGVIALTVAIIVISGVLLAAIIISISLVFPAPVAAVENVTMAWVRRYDGGTGLDEGKAIVVDNGGNVCVTGYMRSAANHDNFATIRYTSLGAKQWLKLYDGPGHAEDQATAIVTDNISNVFVTGYCTNAAGNKDYVTIKYTAAGVQQWVKMHDGIGHGDDTATAIAVDGDGNVCVTGWASIVAGWEYTTIKYNTAGERQWIATYRGPGLVHWAYELAVDSSGNVYVTGESERSHNNYDIATIKYSDNGTQLWVKRYTPPTGSARANAIVLDGNGNVYVTGVGGNASGNPDYTTLKYSNAGVLRWQRRYNGPGNADDTANAIGIDNGNNVYITGFSKNAAAFYDYATVKYSDNGTRQWVRRYNGPSNGTDKAKAIFVEGSGNVYVTGYSQRNGINEDYATIKYDSDGLFGWLRRYNGPGDGADGADAIAVGGGIYVTGYSKNNTSGNSDFTTIKYQP